MKTIDSIKEEFKKGTGKKYPIYIYEGKQVAFFMDGSDAEALGLNIIDVDAFNHAAVLYDADVVQEWLDKHLLWWPQVLNNEQGKDGIEIIVGRVLPEDSLGGEKYELFASLAYVQCEDEEF